MWGAVRRYEGITHPPEAGRLVDESFLPLLEHVPAFVAYYWIDAGDGVMASSPQVTEGHVVATDTAVEMAERRGQ